METNLLKDKFAKYTKLKIDFSKLLDMYFIILNKAFE